MMSGTLYTHDRHVKEAIMFLVGKGFKKSSLEDLSSTQIDTYIAPQFPQQALVLRQALIRSEEERSRLTLLGEFGRFVGRVHCIWSSEDVKVQGSGTAVLVGEEGLIMTALHVVEDEPPLDSKVTALHKKRKGLASGSKNTQKRRFGAGVIRVTYPFFSDLEFQAEVVFIGNNPDLALLRPGDPSLIPPNLPYFASWSLRAPEPFEKIILIAYPSCVDEDFRSRKESGDQPTGTTGAVAGLTSRRFLHTCPSSSGSSGGLILSLTKDYLGRHGVGIHTSISHDLQSLGSGGDWEERELKILKWNLANKGYYGIASRAAEALVDRCTSRLPHIPPTIKQAAKKVCCHKPEPASSLCKKDENAESIGENTEVEELDLFGPWPVLHDIFGMAT